MQGQMIPVFDVMNFESILVPWLNSSQFSNYIQGKFFLLNRASITCSRFRRRRDFVSTVGLLYSRVEHGHVGYNEEDGEARCNGHRARLQRTRGMTRQRRRRGRGLGGLGPNYKNFGKSLSLKMPCV